MGEIDPLFPVIHFRVHSQRERTLVTPTSFFSLYHFFTWTSYNAENFFGFDRYYTVEFKISEHAVSVRQKPALLRKSREWGETRLAVEGWLSVIQLVCM